MTINDRSIPDSALLEARIRYRDAKLQLHNHLKEPIQGGDGVEDATAVQLHLDTVQEILKLLIETESEGLGGIFAKASVLRTLAIGGSTDPVKLLAASLCEDIAAYEESYGDSGHRRMDSK